MQAVGSTILAQLTNHLLVDIIKISGIHSVAGCVLCPMATVINKFQKSLQHY